MGGRRLGEQKSKGTGHLEGLTPRGVGEPGGTSAARADGGRVGGQSSEGSRPRYQQRPLTLASSGLWEWWWRGGGPVWRAVLTRGCREEPEDRSSQASVFLSRKGACAPSLKEGSGA